MVGPAVASNPSSGFSNEISIPVNLEQIIFISIPVNLEQIIFISIPVNLEQIIFCEHAIHF